MISRSLSKSYKMELLLQRDLQFLPFLLIRFKAEIKSNITEVYLIEEAVLARLDRRLSIMEKVIEGTTKGCEGYVGKKNN